MIVGASELESVLQARFKLKEFRPQQEDAIRNVLEGRDTVVVMPTGGGKSLCYQLPALLMPGLTLVISPLISLMKDQVDKLRSLGIQAASANSANTFAEVRAGTSGSGTLKLLFISPERLESERFREQLAELNVSLLAIDEAHCISEWGHDFRTSYRRITESFIHFAGGRPPILALTATATPEVRADIIEQLELRSPQVIVTGFERENLFYGVLRETEKLTRITESIASIDGSAIVYASSRKAVDGIVVELRKRGIAVEGYHAGMHAALRKQVQERFLAGRSRVIVATSAFGMGIDKSDVRLVVHHDLPSSIEAYYQEAGRAGRDGRPAMAVLMYNQGDERVHQFLIRSSMPAEAELRNVYTALHDIARNPAGSVHEEMLILEESSVWRRTPKTSTALARILDVLEEEGYVRQIRNLSNLTRHKAQFLAGRGRLEEASHRSQDRSLKHTIGALVRTLGAEAFAREVQFDLDEMLSANDITSQTFKNSMRILESLGLIRYVPPPHISGRGTVHALMLLGERWRSERLPLRTAYRQARLERSLGKLDQMLLYVTEWRCRQQMILEYFGERPGQVRCGRCDVCQSKQ